MLRVLWVIVVAVGVAACGGGSKPQESAAPAAAPPPSPPALESFPAARDASLRYELAIDQCAADSCPIVVRLVKSGAAIDSARLTWPAPSHETSVEDVDPPWGAGDPLAPTPLKARAAGEETTYVSTLARPIRLSADATGLLVTQRAGWEHVKHRHDLFVNDGSKLRIAWSGTEGAGPTWSSTDVLPAGDNADRVIFFSGFQDPRASEPDSLSVTSIAWNASDRRAVESPVDDASTLRMVVVGSFANAARARAVRDAASSCLNSMWWVLNQRLYEGAPGPFFVAAVTARPAAIPAVLESAGRCTPRMTGTSLPYREHR